MLLFLIWTSSPILVAIVSFFVYVARGNELTIGTAFAVCLFLSRDNIYYSSSM